MTNQMNSARLSTQDLSLSFGKSLILDQFNLSIPDGKITVIIGPNACGKSTLLRTMARLINPSSGTILLDGKTIAKQSTKDVAKKLGILPQMPTAPRGITVADLISRGRTPHQSVWRQWSKADEIAIDKALEMTGVTLLADKPFEALSGGQKQRVWIAMALAQETDILLLDEPTTFLDLSHQIEVLELLKTCNSATGTTIAMVLHDINLAARYADHLIAMRSGEIVVQGSAEEVITKDVLKEVFNLDCTIMPDPVKKTPMVIPL